MIPLYRLRCVFDRNAGRFNRQRVNTRGSWRTVYCERVINDQDRAAAVIVKSGSLYLLVPRSVRNGALVNPLALLNEYLVIARPNG